MSGSAHRPTRCHGERRTITPTVPCPRSYQSRVLLTIQHGRQHDNAAALGVGRAFLFTTNARAHFEGLGFEVVDRSRAPQSILTTRQAIGLCPASAVLLTRAVTP